MHVSFDITVKENTRKIWTRQYKCSEGKKNQKLDIKMSI